MELIEFLKVVLLGMFEGLTEFAPISSTGHMILVDEMWLHSDDFLGRQAANTFKIVIQLGSILAVVVVFHERFRDLLLRNPGKQERLSMNHILIGLLPATLIGFLLEDYIDNYLFTIQTVMVGLVIGALLMIVADLRKPKDSLRTIDQLTYRQAFTIGLFQCLSLWPGFSRSGATISAGVLVGLSHRAAADFTFIMAVPIMIGASTLSLIKNMTSFTTDLFPFLTVGFFSAFIFALLSIQFFLHLINRVRLIPFAVYRLLLTLVIYLVYF
ncbi:undecaprenyl-diphosphate phosphatase [Halobacillus litoralis]|uniref:undecaprenyl-diphosphate phosphatase n=1 Tax=Halobacillus litoralis TaxID=45668 RepID=UPI001CFC7677|nr:undecaprenyl-diphosphate phosphatase [Halobacillus litoralis]